MTLSNWILWGGPFNSVTPIGRMTKTMIISTVCRGKLVCSRIRRISIRSPNPRRIDTNGGNPSNRWKSWFQGWKGIVVSFTRLPVNWIYFVEGNFIRIDSNEANPIIPIVNENLPGILRIYGHLHNIHVMNGIHLIPQLKGDENLLHFRKGNSHAMCECL